MANEPGTTAKDRKDDLPEDPLEILRAAMGAPAADADLQEPSSSDQGAHSEQASLDASKKRGWQKILINPFLALILLIGAAVVAWQFFGERPQGTALAHWLKKGAHNYGTAPQRETYYCPMHPDYKSDKPGNCPICSMKLVKFESAAGSAGPSQSERPAGDVPNTAEMGADSSAPTAPAGQAPNTIFIAPQQQQLIGVQTAPVAFQSLVKEIRTVGKISYDETRITHIHTKVSGWIEKVFVDFVGKFVKKGDPLFTIYSPDLVATQEEYLLALRAQESFANSPFERAANSARNLIEASRRRLRLWDVGEEEIARLEKERKARRELTIYSPASGVVTERAAYHHGRYITPETDLYTIVDLSKVWALGEIYEYELPFVKQGQTVEVEMPYNEGPRSVRGAVSYIYPYLNPTTRTAQIRVEFSNPEHRLKPNMFVNVKLRINLGRQLTVPEDAVLDTGRQQYVFIDKGNGYFEPRAVKLGAQANGRYAIKQGLKEGERVVTAANFILDSESRLKGTFAAMGAPQKDMPVVGGAAQEMQIKLSTEPDPARVGDNTVRVKVTDSKGSPVTEASVRVKISMPAMGSMPPMSSEAQLSHQGNGEYSGTLNISMAWTWQTVVTVERGGKLLGSARFNITAR